MSGPKPQNNCGKQTNLKQKKTPEKVVKARPCCRFISQDNLEPHKVETEDGYLLTVFRFGAQSPEVALEKEDEPVTKKGPPVLMITGLANNGKEWVFEAERESLREIKYDVIAIFLEII